MTQTTYEPPDWGYLLTQIDRDLAAGGTPSDVISYSIAGRSFTKSRAELMTFRDFVLGEYNRIAAGGNVTYADNSGGQP